MAEKEVDQLHKPEPRFFYGYIVVVAAFLILVISFALYSSFGLFLKPLETEFGWTRAITSGAFSLSMIIYGVLSIVMGGLSDRFGPRLVMTLCGFLLGLGYLLMSQVTTVWQLYLFFGVIVGIGTSGVWVPQMSSVARWFVRRRSLMTGIVIAGTGVGQLVGPPVISRLIAAYDWRLSFIILGSVVLVSTIVIAQFLKRDPAQMGQLPYGADEGIQHSLKSASKDFSFREAVPTAQFWIVFIMYFCAGFSVFGIVVHIVPHASELEISAISAANILAAIGGVGILGNYALGGVGDKIGNRWIYIIGFIMMSAGMLWLVSARELWMLYAFATILGLAFGGTGATESPLVAGLFGVGSHGLIYGVIHLGFTVGAAFGPYLMGYIFDITGNYQVAFLVGAVLSVAGLILTIILRPTKRLGGRI